MIYDETYNASKHQRLGIHMMYDETYNASKHQRLGIH